tara:strand:- start:21473 stop:22201 length:729 start_codon:yes stop_codon:yes gene_type:complete
MKYVFDVDGTLTPSRSPMDPEFQEFFLDFVKNHEVYLVTGSDYPKTIEQIGEEICMNVNGVFSCAGNQMFIRGEEHYRQFNFELLPSEKILLEDMLVKSPFMPKTGKHIERRVGLINFSIVGRNATRDQRNAYVKYDTEHKEREYIRLQILSNTRLDCSIAGETGIDIYPPGRDKGQITEQIGTDIVFFGDRCDAKGNDYPLAKLAEMVYNVKSWKDTFSILQSYATGSSDPNSINYWRNFT